MEGAQVPTLALIKSSQIDLHFGDLQSDENIGLLEPDDFGCIRGGILKASSNRDE